MCEWGGVVDGYKFILDKYEMGIYGNKLFILNEIWAVTATTHSLLR